MGSKLCCICIQKSSRRSPSTSTSRRRGAPGHGVGAASATLHSPQLAFNDSDVINVLFLSGMHSRARSGAVEVVEEALRTRSPKPLILHTLNVVRSRLDNEQGPPWSLQLLHEVAESEHGWKQIMSDVVDVIPDHDPLAPVAISVIVEETPVPSKKLIEELRQLLNISEMCSEDDQTPALKKRNICILLSCLAEKMAGPSSISLLSDDVLKFFFHNIRCNDDPSVTLFSIIALEKFALTGENKQKIVSCLKEDNVFEGLECHHDDELNYLLREIGFCARWSMDNLFVMENRIFSYTTHDQSGDSGVNVLLNHEDVSEYLKLSSAGLEARCDAMSFESVRCTLPVTEGVWYYEVKVVTSGIMQVGWASKNSKFLNQEGFGVGDDDKSIAYDGCRQLIWHNAESTEHGHPVWKKGDILGLLLDMENKQVVFSLNGNSLEPNSKLFDKPSDGGYYAAASFMSFQQCIFNFGVKPFVHPPTCSFKKLNDHGVLTAEERCILPRHMKLAKLKHMSISEDSCVLCADRKACVVLMPCQHLGFCKECASQLQNCPMCRQNITDRSSTSEPAAKVTSTTVATEIQPRDTED